MSALELLARLREHSIWLRAVEGELEVDAPAGALTTELRAAIVANRADLLKLLSWSRRSQRAAGAALQGVPRTQPLPLSWSQQRLWFLDQLEPGSAAYNLAWTVRLRGALDVAALGSAFTHLVRRHETLRTRFPAQDGEPWQEVCPLQPFELQREVLAGAGTERLRARLGEIAAAPFDLAEGPLLRAALLQLAADEHVLLVVMHHIVSDGASMRILFRELAACYEAALSGTEAELPPLPVQYADYAVWQRQWLDGEEIERQSDYWRQQLDGLPPLLELPWDRPRAAAMRYRGASVLRLLPADLANELRGLARSQGCTLFMVMLSAFFVLLQRYAGRDDLVLGTPLGGRSRTQLEGLIGFFINTVVLRARLDGNPAFTALLQQVRSTALDAHANQDLPFEKLVELLQPQRELSYSPVFQVMFDLQEEPRWRLPVRELEVVPEVIFSSRTASFDLTLSVRQAEEGLDAMFEYDTDLFDEGSIENLAAHYQSLLEAIVRAPDSRILDLPLVAPEWQRQLEQGWIGAAVPYPDTADIATLFAGQAAATPNAIAVVHGTREVSYRELAAGMHRLAGCLRQAGVVPGATVAVLAGRGVDRLAAMLALLQSGACVMPLDPAWPAARVRTLLDAAAPALLVADRVAAGGLDASASPCPVLWLDEARAAEPLLTPVQVDAAAPAFLLYTSGTTGTPKGVRLAHRGLVNYLMQLGRKTGLGPAQRVLQFASPAFDIALEETFGALLHGATLVLRTEAMSRSLEDFVAGCEAQRVSWMSLPTAWWHELCAGLEHGVTGVPSALQCLVIGGEKAEREALRRWRAQAPAVRVFNTYGPTEASIAASWCELTHWPTDGGAELPIGRPVPNVQIWIMDAQLRPQPVGVPGEICIGGVGLALGYYRQDALTEERFVSFTAADGSTHRVYRTGDRGRYVADGSVMFLGRLDSQFKLRGYRIEPGEVEAAVLAQPGVHRCAVVLHGQGSTARLLAYYTGPAEAATLRAALKRELPDYMVPATLIPLPQLPFTANGKLDRQALPPPATDIAAVPAAEQPQGEVEQRIANIWCELLGVTQPGRHDSFFDLGGHSLLATRAVARLREAFGQALPLRTLFDQPTIAGLAVAIASGQQLPAGYRPQARAAEGLQPLSWAQQRLWVLDRLQPGLAAYHLYTVTELCGALNAPALQRALDTVVARHAILRTRFVETGGEPAQLVLPDAGITLVEEAAPAEDASLQARLRHWIDLPFDLQRGELLRPVLFTLPDAADGRARHLLLLVMHHIVADGWSLAVLYRELAAAYAANCRGVAPLLPQLGLQYTDFALWQRAQPADSPALAYWLQQLTDAPPYTGFPTDYSRPAEQGFAGGWVTADIDAAETAALTALAQREQCTLFMVLLAAFKVLLARHSGRSDVVVGTQVAGREYTALEPLIGCFLNTLVLRTQLGAAPSLREVLHAVRNTALEAYEHQAVPFEHLLERLQPERNLAHTPLVQVLFNLHNEGGGRLQLDGLDTRAWLLDRAAPKFDLSVAVQETAAGLRIGFEYNADLYAAATVAEWLRQYRVLLATLLQAPDSGAGEVVLAAAPHYPRPAAVGQRIASGATVSERFAAVAAHHAARPAIEHPHTRWDYATLAVQVDAVAAQLLALGLQPGARVALLLGHDGWAVAGMLGALRAGMTYVPLDPEQPPARTRRLLADSAAALVLSDSRHAGQVRAGVPDTLPLLLVDAAVAVTDHVWPEVSPEALAYILFTSGSTGQPKGVLQSQAHLLQHIDAYSDALGLTASDRLSLLPRYGFDAAVMDIYAALLNGACLVPLDPLDRGGDVARRALVDVSIVHATPTVWRFLFETAAPGALPAMRCLVLGGEVATPADHALFCRHAAPTALFINGYGPSESTLATQYIAPAVPQLFPGGAVPIGLPVAGTTIELVDAAGKPTAFAGEIVIRSARLACGYLDVAANGAGPFSDVAGVPGERRYRSGDLAFRRPDGQLVYLGRRDAQLKLRGYRIEPAEIERVLMTVPGVALAAVVLRDGRLTACVTGTAARDEVLATVRRELPRQLQPEVLLQLPALPLKPNGKLDVAALPVEQPTAATVHAPCTATEAAVLAEWQALLPAGSSAGIGIDSDFFALGGHSLLATRLLARLRQRFGTDVPLRVFFAAPTIAALAAEIDARAAATPAAADVIAPLQDELPPLSWSQQRLWFLDQLEPGNPAYNLHWAASLEGELDIAALQGALNTLVARHAALRTGFVMHAGEPAQLILAGASCTLVVEQFPGATPEQLQPRLHELLRRPFELQRAPLFRAHLLQSSPTRAVLLLVMHHIVSDGWSMGVLFRELGACYTARLSDETPALPELPVEFAAFAAWQRQRVAGAYLDRLAAYWQAQLAGLPPLLALPADRNRPPVQRHRGAWVSEQLAADVLERLHTLAREQGCTLFMVLLAAFKVLLLRHTGREDIVVAAPVAGRVRSEVEHVVGCFLNTLVLRTQVQAGLPFTDLLERVRDCTLGAYEHQELPFEKLLELLHPARSLAYSPLVQVSFNLHNQPGERLQLPGLAVEVWPLDRGTSKFDLSAALVESAHGLHIGFEYNSDLFDENTVAVWLAQYAGLLEAFARDPQQTVATVPMSVRPMTEVSFTALTGGMPTPLQDPAIDTLAAAFAAVVARHPERPAVSDAGGTLSYAELDARVAALAEVLLRLPRPQQPLLGLLLGHDATMVVGLLAAIRAGLPYAPLDPQAPPARLHELLTNAGVHGLLVDPAAGVDFAALPALPVVTIDGVTLQDGGPAEAGDMPSSIARRADDLAYVLFTSGSTGTPKGVMQSHRGVLHHIRSYSGALALTAEDRLSLFSSYAFDAAVMDIFGALLNGACLHPHDLRREQYPGEVLDRMADAGISVLHATPTVFRYLMRARVCRHELTRMRAVVLGGEEARAGDFELFRRHFAPPTLFINGFGPSECTIATQFIASHATPLPGRQVPIGVPVAGTEVRLLDAAGRDTALSGELAICSPAVALGYWRDPELTAARFVADPLQPGRRMYRSGDRARRLPDGQLLFLGRIDDQVKIRGHRVEPAEVEAALLNHAGAERAAVIARPDPHGGGELQLVAYVTGGADVGAMRKALRTALPEYMLPAAIVPLAELPRTANGKVDRQALPAPMADAGRENYIAPRSETEIRLARIWADVLGRSRIGVEDDFFELGGHSLQAAQLVARINEAFQVVIPIRRLFDAPTVAAIAPQVDTLLWALQGVTTLPEHRVQDG